MKRIFALILTILSYCNIAWAKDLKQITGTPCRLVPPDGFVPSARHNGFQNDELNAIITIVQYPVDHYERKLADFTVDHFKKLGMTLIRVESFNFNDNPATYLESTIMYHGTLYDRKNIMYSDGSFTYLIAGIYPNATKFIEKPIKKAILSTVCDTNPQNILLNSAGFSIDTEGTDFFFTRYDSGTLIFSNTSERTADSPLIFVGSITVAKSFTDEQKMAYAESNLKSLSNKAKIKIRETNPVTIDNMNGYETIGDGKFGDGKAVLIYQTALFDDNGSYYSMIGLTTEDFEVLLGTFKKLAHTFKRD